MTKPLATDFPQREMARLDAGEAVREIAEAPSVAPSSVVRWSQRRRVTGKAAPGKIGGHGPRKSCPCSRHGPSDDGDAANDGDGDEHPVAGRARLAGSGLLAPEPSAKDYEGADSRPPGARTAEPRPTSSRRTPPARESRRGGIRFLAMANGSCANTAHTAGARIAGFLWQWIRPPATPGPWSSPQATRVTAPSFRTYRTKFHAIGRSAS